MAAAVWDSFSCFFEAEVTSMFINVSRLVSARSGVGFWVWAMAVSDTSSEAQRNTLRIGKLLAELVSGLQAAPGCASANSAGEPGSNWQVQSRPAGSRSSISCFSNRSLIFVAPTYQTPRGVVRFGLAPVSQAWRGHLRGHTRLRSVLLGEENQGVTKWYECANGFTCGLLFQSGRSAPD